MFLSCSPPAHKSSPSPKIDAAKAFAFLKTGSAIKPRHSGSAGAAETVKFISRHIEQWQIPFKLDKWIEDTPEGRIEFCNVIADIPGKEDKYILIGCHYDTKKLVSVPDFEGANDGASGVALVLAMMKTVKDYPQPPPASLKFVFFDGEECFIEYTDRDGLFGSRHFAAELEKSGKQKDCLAVVILDMVGDKDLNITIPAGSNKKLSDQLLNIAAAQKNEKFFSHHDIDILDDHTPFQKLDIPVIDIIDFKFGKGNRYWHTSADTIENTSQHSLKIVGDAALQLLWDIPEIL